ncbi:MAG: bile acid:Na+ symporter, BASS family [Bacteroidetes bacterium HLUCCA01]|nr:MAG: bile acid:Na+ symporter, BASS family [Bacteroidetes bacterium HLUCCA01]
MEESILTAVFLPLALAFIMLGMGLTLTPADFRRILIAPKAIVLGLVAQLVLLPLLGFALVYLFGLTGALAVGVMILAACPGGPTSNLVSHLAKGDLALSISLTAISSVVTVATIPLIVNFAILHFGEEGSVTLPVLQTIIQIMGVTLVPVALGMYIRSRRPAWSDRAEKPFKMASAVFFVLIILAAILKERENLIEFFILTGPIALTLNVVTMGLGYALARWLLLPIRQRIAISIESGIQNGTLGIMIAATLLQNSEMTIPVAIYSLLMFFTVMVVIYAGNRLVKDVPTV